MTPETEKQLRKAWLKQRFGSWEYHEELLRLHEDYLTSLKRHWSDPALQKRHPGDYRGMISPVFFNLDRVSKPGTIPRASWKAGKETGWTTTISYNFNRGMDYAGVNEYQELSDAERQRLNELVAQMLHIQENIRITVEDAWDGDDILDIDLTGPIDWPPNWKDELPTEVIATAQGSVPKPRPNVPAGHPCPEAGWWFTPAQAGSRRWFRHDEIMPALGGDYGQTFWQWSPDQSAPRL
ncbi:hypothetical protein [Aromatoleum evansii]|uniref:hypothetical protein n=1 Tax=Aromatoleum evansii TaxID=59406 RepID=UPI00145E294B|nr:hypothetical protein [Aromatoleum evansii]NMG29889.1 hypothetical protein [Aromatoleum evansii]